MLNWPVSVKVQNLKRVIESDIKTIERKPLLNHKALHSKHFIYSDRQNLIKQFLPFTKLTEVLELIGIERMVDRRGELEILFLLGQLVCKEGY